jgi:hypothetical protein
MLNCIAMTPFDSALIEKVYSPITGWVNQHFGVDHGSLRSSA